MWKADSYLSFNDSSFKTRWLSNYKADKTISKKIQRLSAVVRELRSIIGELSISGKGMVIGLSASLNITLVKAQGLIYEKILNQEFRTIIIATISQSPFSNLPIGRASNLHSWIQVS